MGQLIYEEGVVPDIILSSTARRARDTADLVAEASGFEGDVVYLEDFYHGSPSEYIEALQALPDEFNTAMVVGHNPGMEMLLELISDESERFPTAALALIKLPIDFWSQLNDEIEGELIQFLLPRELPN
jgi:phosphohistidine phosphatase